MDNGKIRKPMRLSTKLLIIGLAAVVADALFFYFALQHPTAETFLPPIVGRVLFYGSFFGGIAVIVLAVVMNIFRAVSKTSVYMKGKKT